MKNCRPGLVIAAALTLAACSNVADKDSNVAEKSGKTITMVSGNVVDPDEVTCKTYKKAGSRIGTKHCLRNSEWKLKSERARETTESIQRQSKQVGDKAAGG